jgi:transcription initiation factor TFIIIB Brf1 subunit/transcription initiation factor TFIIB
LRIADRSPNTLAAFAVYLAVQLSTHINDEKDERLSIKEIVKDMNINIHTLKEVYREYKEEIPQMLKGVKNIKPWESLQAP